MKLLDKNIITENLQVFLPILEEKKIELWVKREDKIHKFISGNKFRKLKYNIKEAKKLQKSTLLTFGGAYSNHIVATAVAGQMYGLKTIGIIRGDELANRFDEVIKENETLKNAHEHNMHFDFIDRETYRNKDNEEFIQHLKNKYGDIYIIPEGGTNLKAVKGCEEILTPYDEKFDYICSAIGTGGTIAGIINSVSESQKVLGFPALKGDFLIEDVKKYINIKSNWSINTNYTFGGYAKYNQELICFINSFYKKTSIPLDPIYTSKMLFGILDLIDKDYFKPGQTILAIHTGGLQGISGVNKKLKKKKLEEIKVL